MQYLWTKIKNISNQSKSRSTPYKKEQILVIQGNDYTAYTTKKLRRMGLEAQSEVCYVDQHLEIK